MASASFSYVEIPAAPDEAHPQGRMVYRPVAPAIITASNGEWLRWFVLPDSGADICLFPLSLAIGLKLDVLHLPKTSMVGVGGQSNAIYYDFVTVDMGSGIVFEVEAGFSQSAEPVGVGLLGQEGFFSKYNVEFRHAAKEFLVRLP